MAMAFCLFFWEFFFYYIFKVLLLIAWHGIYDTPFKSHINLNEYFERFTSHGIERAC